MAAYLTKWRILKMFGILRNNFGGAQRELWSCEMREEQISIMIDNGIISNIVMYVFKNCHI